MDFLQRWFFRRSVKVERLLLICTAVLLALLLMSQLLMIHPGVRYFLSRVDSLEGDPYRGPCE